MLPIIGSDSVLPRKMSGATKFVLATTLALAALGVVALAGATVGTGSFYAATSEAALGLTLFVGTAIAHARSKPKQILTNEPPEPDRACVYRDSVEDGHIVYLLDGKPLKWSDTQHFRALQFVAGDPVAPITINKTNVEDPFYISEQSTKAFNSFTLARYEELKRQIPEEIFPLMHQGLFVPLARALEHHSGLIDTGNLIFLHAIDAPESSSMRIDVRLNDREFHLEMLRAVKDHHENRILGYVRAKAVIHMDTGAGYAEWSELLDEVPRLSRAW